MTAEHSKEKSCTGHCDECKNKEVGSESRRKLLGMGVMVGVINAGVAAAILAPTAGFVVAPVFEKQPEGQWVPVLDEAELADGETKLIAYQVEEVDGYMKAQRRYSAYLQRNGAEVVAYDPSCPHLGCSVAFKEAKQRFMCPCHGAVFSADGKVVSGPPPKGLTRLATKIDSGKILVNRRLA